MIKCLQETRPISPRRTPEHWQQRYLSGDVPWDTGEVSPELIARTRELPPAASALVLEIGCGTGTNAIWLARQGFETLGVDVAARAIELACERARDAAVASVTFVVGDILQGLPVDPGSCALVFDRGCFHAVSEDDRPRFVDRVFEASQAEAHWLTLCGNADEKRAPGAHGPPQLSGLDIVRAVERRFVILSLRQQRFHDQGGKSHLSWECLMRKRA